MNLTNVSLGISMGTLGMKLIPKSSDPVPNGLNLKHVFTSIRSYLLFILPKNTRSTEKNLLINVEAEYPAID